MKKTSIEKSKVLEQEQKPSPDENKLEIEILTKVNLRTGDQILIKNNNIDTLFKITKRPESNSGIFSLVNSEDETTWKTSVKTLVELWKYNKLTVVPKVENVDETVNKNDPELSKSRGKSEDYIPITERKANIKKTREKVLEEREERIKNKAKETQEIIEKEEREVAERKEKIETMRKLMAQNVVARLEYFEYKNSGLEQRSQKLLGPKRNYENSKNAVVEKLSIEPNGTAKIREFLTQEFELERENDAKNTSIFKKGWEEVKTLFETTKEFFSRRLVPTIVAMATLFSFLPNRNIDGKGDNTIKKEIEKFENKIPTANITQEKITLSPIPVTKKETEDILENARGEEKTIENVVEQKFAEATTMGSIKNEIRVGGLDITGVMEEIEKKANEERGEFTLEDSEKPAPSVIKTEDEKPMPTMVNVEEPIPFTYINADIKPITEDESTPAPEMKKATPDKDFIGNNSLKLDAEQLQEAYDTYVDNINFFFGKEGINSKSWLDLKGLNAGETIRQKESPTGDINGLRMALGTLKYFTKLEPEKDETIDQYFIRAWKKVVKDNKTVSVVDEIRSKQIR